MSIILRANATFTSVAQMTSIYTDHTAEDGLGVFCLLQGDQQSLVVWRKNSSLPVDNVNVWAGNPTGQWIKIQSNSSSSDNSSLSFFNTAAELEAFEVNVNADDGSVFAGLAIDNERYELYLYRSNSTETANGDTIINSSNGRWVKYNPLLSGTDEPTTSPHQPSLYLQNTAETQHLYGYSNDTLGWQRLTSAPIVLSESPTTAPAHIGMTYIDTSTNTYYVAIGNTDVTDWEMVFSRGS